MVDSTCLIHLCGFISEFDLAHGQIFPEVLRHRGPNQKAQGLVLRRDLLHNISGPRQDRKGNLNTPGIDLLNHNRTNPVASRHSLRGVQVIEGGFNMERYLDKSMHLDLGFIWSTPRGGLQSLGSDSVQRVLGDEEPNIFRGKHHHRANFHGQPQTSSLQEYLLQLEKNYYK